MVRTETVLFFSSQPPGSKCSTSVERHGATPSKQKEKCYFDACLKAWMNNDQRVFTCNGPLSATKTTPSMTGHFSCQLLLPTVPGSI